MPTIIPPAFGLVSHLFRLDDGSAPSGPMVVTYGVNIVGDGQETLDTCCEYFGSVVEGICNEQFQVYLSTLKQGPNSTGPSFENATVMNGTIAGAAATVNVAYLVRKTTGAGGRANRGRLYLPGVTESKVSAAGAVASTDLTDYNNVLNTWRLGLALESIEMQILHSESSDPTPVTQIFMDPKVATQRRRLR